MRHVPVLLQETIEGLNLHEGDIVIDCTLGDAGHAQEILELIMPTGKLIGIDADAEALLRAKQYLYRFAEHATFVRDNFSNLSSIAHAEGVHGKVHAILADLGWSTPQFAERGRGFSFLPEHEEELLDMRYGTGAIAPAYELLDELSESQLADMFQEYADESLSVNIAHAIAEQRKKMQIRTVKDLVDIILQQYREKLRTEKEIPWIGGSHPATKVFQAIRIAVNDEYGVIKKFIPEALEVLAPGGILGIITFHSGEDRIVKHMFKKAAGKGLLQLITNKPITCSPEEEKVNPPSRSAKLRLVKKI